MKFRVCILTVILSTLFLLNTHQYAFSDETSLTLSPEGVLLNKDQLIATAHSAEHFFEIDHEHAHAIFSSEALPLALRENSIQGQVLSSLELMDGTTKTYENAWFDNIQFLSSNYSGTEIKIDSERALFLLQARHRDSKIFQFFILELNGSRFNDRNNRNELGVPTFRIYLISGAWDSDRYKPTDIALSNLSSLRHFLTPLKSIVTDAGVWDGGLFGYIQTTGKAHLIANIVNSTNDSPSTASSNVFLGDEKDFGRMSKPYIIHQVIRPICRHYETGLALMIQGTQYGDVTLSNGRCKISTWVGSMTIYPQSPKKIDCNNGKCDFVVDVRCNARGTMLLEACATFTDDLRRQFGSYGGIPGEAVISDDGKIDSISMNFRTK